MPLIKILEGNRMHGHQDLTNLVNKSPQDGLYTGKKSNHFYINITQSLLCEAEKDIETSCSHEGFSWHRFHSQKTSMVSQRNIEFPFFFLYQLCRKKSAF